MVHEWWGLNDYAKRRARDLAALGYSAMAIDMYGEGKNTEHPKDAMAFMQAALKDSDAADKRFDAGLEQLKQQPQTDPKKLQRSVTASAARSCWTRRGAANRCWA